MKALILGHKGMLGNMVVKFLQPKCEVVHIDARFPSDEFNDAIQAFDGDYIINCIGAIPQRTKAFDVNYELPVWLCINAKCKIIHPGTDCEIDENGYGISKRNASQYIKSNFSNTKIIKTSIIGPEVHSSHSLLSWFLNSNGSVKGYKNSLWSGITTLEWAKICWDMMRNWDSFETENIVSGTCLSKYDLLCLIKEVYNKNIDIVPYENELVDKCLNGNIITKNIKEQLVEMKDYYESH